MDVRLEYVFCTEIEDQVDVDWMLAALCSNPIVLLWVVVTLEPPVGVRLSDYKEDV